MKAAIQRQRSGGFAVGDPGQPLKLFIQILVEPLAGNTNALAEIMGPLIELKLPLRRSGSRRFSITFLSVKIPGNLVTVPSFLG